MLVGDWELFSLVTANSPIRQASQLEASYWWKQRPSMGARRDIEPSCATAFM